LNIKQGKIDATEPFPVFVRSGKEPENHTAVKHPVFEIGLSHQLVKSYVI
jgi:hypothetical protein